MEFSYSVDMLRLETKVDADIFSTWISNATVIYCKTDIVEHMQSFRHSDYRELFHVKGIGVFNYEYGYAVMFHHNMEKASRIHKLVIEFNPNKVPFIDEFLHALLGRFFTSSVVKQLDIAVDIPVDIHSVVWGNTGKSRIMTYSEKGGYGVYFGVRGSGQVKMYDKAKELGLPQEKVLTRIEKTVSLDLKLEDAYRYDFSDCAFPDFFVPGNIDRLDCSLGALEQLVIIGLRERPDLMQSLSKNTRKKYSGLLRSEKIELEHVKMSGALKYTLDEMAIQAFGWEKGLIV